MGSLRTSGVPALLLTRFWVHLSTSNALAGRHRGAHVRQGCLPQGTPAVSPLHLSAHMLLQGDTRREYEGYHPPVSPRCFSRGFGYTFPLTCFGRETPGGIQALRVSPDREHPPRVGYTRHGESPNPWCPRTDSHGVLGAPFHFHALSGRHRGGTRVLRVSPAGDTRCESVAPFRSHALAGRHPP